MKTRAVIKGEKHHWWPEGLSKYWSDDEGSVRRIDVTGKVISSNPKEFGKISDGHNILFENASPWQSTIEHYFDRPDQHMPRVVDWLQSFAETTEDTSGAGYQRHLQELECETLDLLRECLISLLVRSPRYRNAQSSLVESFRGELKKAETKRLIAANIHQKYGTLVNRSKGIGKFALLISREAEFIYGDGVYSSLGAATEDITGLKVAIPMTPNIAVIWSSPLACPTHPRLVAIEANERLVAIINDSVQVYSKEYLFFRSQQPRLRDDFKCCEHRIYSHATDPVYSLIESLIPDDSRRRPWFDGNLT